MLNYFLENNHLIREYQIGFRKSKSTTDASVKLSNEIEKSLVIKEVMVTFFLDIEKAYDSVERRFITSIGEQWNQWEDVQLHFLSKRTLRVTVGDGISEEYMVEWYSQYCLI